MAEHSSDSTLYKVLSKVNFLAREVKPVALK